MTTLVANIRHDLDPALVQASVAKKITAAEDLRVRKVGESIALLAKYEQSVAANTVYKDWHHKPDSPERITNQFDTWINHEREYYSTVRVVELPTGEKRFILVYGDAADATVTEGTGPFDTLSAAVNWFTQGGR